MKSSSLALHYAHQLQKNAAEQMLLSSKNKPVNWAQRVRLGWYYVNLREWLKNGIVIFSFWKKDGTIREAKGTLNDLLIPLDKRPHMDLQHEPNYSAIAFYDLDKNDWRSFSITHFIGFVSRWEISKKED